MPQLPKSSDFADIVTERAAEHQNRLMAVTSAIQVGPTSLLQLSKREHC